MKGNQKRFFQLIMVLQIFIISVALVAIPAAAEDLSLPDMPITLEGDVKLDGEPAPVDTAIYVELNGEKASGTISVANEGEYSLPVTYSSEDYVNLKFYVNNIEAKLVDATVLENVNDDVVVIHSVDLTVTSPVSSNADSGSSSSGSSGSSSYRTATVSEETDGESLPESTTSSTTDSTAPLKSVATTQSTDPVEDVPAPETGLSLTIVLIGAIFLLGIIVTVGYKLKEN